MRTDPRNLDVEIFFQSFQYNFFAFKFYIQFQKYIFWKFRNRYAITLSIKITQLDLIHEMVRLS